MNRTTQRLLVTIQVILVGVLLSAGRARAQQVLAWNEGKVPAIQVTPSAEEMRQEDEAHEKLCKAHPRSCGPVDDFLPPTPKQLEDEAKKDPSYYQKPELGHTNWCYEQNPSKYVCIPDTWVGYNPPEYGHCYSNPNNPSEQRCVPTREQLMKAENGNFK